VGTEIGRLAIASMRRTTRWDFRRQPRRGPPTAADRRRHRARVRHRRHRRAARNADRRPRPEEARTAVRRCLATRCDWYARLLREVLAEVAIVLGFASRPHQVEPAIRTWAAAVVAEAAQRLRTLASDPRIAVPPRSARSAFIDKFWSERRDKRSLATLPLDIARVRQCCTSHEPLKISNTSAELLAYVHKGFSMLAQHG
jgi:hypothetical protein